MNSRQKGIIYEEKAVKFLTDRGIQVLERNFRTRQGEIDIVGLQEQCLVFVEVKYRQNERKGSPEEAVGALKQQTICQVSDYYRIRYKKYCEMQVRFDVVAICDEEIRWYQNAFPYHVKRLKTTW